MNYPSIAGIVLTFGGIAGTFIVAHQMATWPDWSLFPAAITAILCMLAMVVGLGVLVVRALER
jgi:hypothetical protein